MIGNIILKCLFLFIAIAYGFTCFGRLVRGQAVSSLQVFLMVSGVVGTVAMWFWL